jgi:hypothetical protein
VKQLLLLTAAVFGLGALAAVLFLPKGVGVEGEILKVRVAPMDASRSVLVVDFRLTNPVQKEFWVRQARLFVTGPDGVEVEGKTFGDADAERVFAYYPLLGQKFNDSIRMRDKIGAAETWDRMIAAHFPLPEALLEARRGIRIRIEEVDGVVSEIRQTESGR